MSDKGRKTERLPSSAARATAPRHVHHAGSGFGADIAAARHHELLRAIAELGERFVPPSVGPIRETPVPGGDAATGAADVDGLRHELTAILETIDGVKREIADLRRDHRLLTMVRDRASTGGDPYDVLAGATDSANAVILASAERIDDLVASRAAATDGDGAAWVDEVGDNLVRIFEACNVHDFASLRVGRFLMTMKQVENRLRLLCEPVTPATDGMPADPPPALQRLSK